MVDAEASLCEVPGIQLRQMSNAAEHVLIMLRKVRYLSQLFEYRRKVKQTIPRIVSRMTARASEFCVTELTRLAWLSLVIDDEAWAKTWTEKGLQMEADNVHCLSLRPTPWNSAAGSQGEGWQEVKWSPISGHIGSYCGPIQSQMMIDHLGTYQIIFDIKMIQSVFLCHASLAPAG